MSTEVEITKEELGQVLEDRGFSNWQIDFAIENAPMVGHSRYIRYMKDFGFNMFQIRYLIKLFSK